LNLSGATESSGNWTFLVRILGASLSQYRASWSLLVENGRPCYLPLKTMD
jgi:hypothetical protein